jgi:hypothetical protein
VARERLSVASWGRLYLRQSELICGSICISPTDGESDVTVEVGTYVGSERMLPETGAVGRNLVRCFCILSYRKLFGCWDISRCLNFGLNRRGLDGAEYWRSRVISDEWPAISCQ